MKPHPLVELGDARLHAVAVTGPLEVVERLRGVAEKVSGRLVEEGLEARLQAVDVHPRLDAAVRVHAADAAEEAVHLLAHRLDDAQQERLDVTVLRVGERGHAAHLAVHRDDIVQDLLLILFYRK